MIGQDSACAMDVLRPPTAVLLFALASPAWPSGEWRLAPPPDWTQTASVPVGATAPEDDVSAGIHYLLVDHQANVEGEPAHYHRLVTRVLSAAGLEEASEIRIGFD